MQLGRTTPKGWPCNVTGNLNLLRKIDGTTMFGLVILSNHPNRSAMRPVSVGIGFM